MLYWIYAARLVISLAVFGSAILVSDFLARRVSPGSLSPEFPLIAIVGLGALGGLEFDEALDTFAIVMVVAIPAGIVTYALIEYLQTRRIDSITRQFDTRTLVLMPVAMALNIVLGTAVASALKIPIYLDSIGTILVASLSGPLAGALTGFLANIVWTYLAPPPFASPFAAPFAGVLRSFRVEQGEYVREGQALGELLDLETARVVIGLSDRQIVVVRSGQPVEVAVEAYPGESFAGSILRVGAASDPSSRKFPVEVELPNPEGRLLPGMIATVAFDLGPEQPRTLIPREASGEEFGLRFVWVVEQEEGEGGALMARRRRVEVRALPFRPAEFEVLSGLAEGEKIALTGTRQLREGERVRRDGTPPR